MEKNDSVSIERAPQNSMDIAALMEAAGDQGIDGDVLRDFLWLINAPPVLSDLADVMANLSEILVAAEVEWSGILELQGLDELPEIS